MDAIEQWLQTRALADGQLPLNEVTLPETTAAPPPPPLTREAVKAGAFERFIWKDVQGLSDLEAVRTKLADQVPFIGDLEQDAFKLFRQEAPEIQEQHLEADYQQVPPALREASSTNTYAGLHELTVNRTLESGLAAAVFAEEVAKELLKHPPTPPPAPEGAEGDEPGPGEPGDKAAPPALDQAGKDAVRAAARKAMQQASQIIQEQQGAFDALGAQERGWDLSQAHPSAADLQKIREYGRMLLNNPWLRDLFRQIGQKQQIAKSLQEKKLKKGFRELSGVEMGDDLARLLPLEWEHFALPELELLWLEDYLNAELLQNRRIGYERVGLGDVLIFIDESDSSTDPILAWFKSLFVVLLNQSCLPYQRNCTLVHFSTTLRIDDFPEGKGSLEQVLDSCIFRLNGGTDFPLVMQTAMQRIRDGKHPGADVVIFSDGKSGHLPDLLVQEWKRLRAERHFLCWIVLAGHDANDKKEMERIGDQVFQLVDLAQDQKVKEVLLSL